MNTAHDGAILGHSVRKRLGAEDGANLVEMALVTVLLLTLIAGIVDLGGAFQNYIIITNAAREGARTAARLPCKADNRVAIRAAIIQATLTEAAGNQLILAETNVAIAPDPLDGCAAPGDPVEVTVTVQYNALLGQLLGSQTFPVRNTATMAYAGSD